MTSASNRGRSVLVVDRFDRTRDADGGPAGRVGYVSAMTMLQSADSEQGSYLEIAEAHCGAPFMPPWARTGTPGGCPRRSTSTRTRNQGPST